MNYTLKILYIFIYCARSLHSYIFKFFINAQTSAAYLLSITSGACIHLKALTATYIKSIMISITWLNVLRSNRWFFSIKHQPSSPCRLMAADETISMILLATADRCNAQRVVLSSVITAQCVRPAESYCTLGKNEQEKETKEKRKG